MAIIELPRHLPRRKFRLPIVLGNIACVPLTRGVAAIIDAEDADLIAQRTWFLDRSKVGDYAATNVVFVLGEPARRIGMHTFLLGMPSSLQVDHADGNGLNNRRFNLRLATVAQNQANRSANANNRLGVKGVRAHKNRFLAEIHVERRTIHVGSFLTVQEASDAYLEAAKFHFGPFARR